MNEMDPVTISLSTKLAELAAKNTFGFVGTKIQEAKTKKTLDEQSTAYSQIINDLLDDKLELERVAREYQDLYEKVTIKDSDIDYLQRTLEKAVEILLQFTPALAEQRQSIDTLIKLLNKDTLKTMQLLGFNYKEAIGEPLTDACSTLIRNSLIKDKKNSKTKKK